MQLPQSVFDRRVQNEHELLQKSGKLVSVGAGLKSFEVAIEGPGLQQVTGVNGSKTVEPITKHRVRIDIARGFPYPGGFDVTWLTPIFHPNIRPTDGKVCIRILSHWTPANTLLSLVEGMERLLFEPNPNDPLNVDAARYYAGLPTGKASMQGANGKSNASTSTPASPRVVSE